MVPSSTFYFVFLVTFYVLSLVSMVLSVRVFRPPNDHLIQHKKFPLAHEQYALYMNGNIGSKHLWPSQMKKLTNCLSTNSEQLQPQSILFIIIASPSVFDAYKYQILAMELYCQIHGYVLQIIDPLQYFYGDNFEVRRYTDLKGKDIYTTSSRPVIMREIFKETYERHGCDVKWLVFLDADIFVVDYARKFESLVAYMDKNYATKMDGLGAGGGAGDTSRHHNISNDSVDGDNSGSWIAGSKKKRKDGGWGWWAPKPSTAKDKGNKGGGKGRAPRTTTQSELRATGRCKVTPFDPLTA